MSVLFLSPVAALGGAERCLLDMLAELRELRPQLPLRVITAEDGPLVAEAAALGALVDVVPMPAVIAKTGESRYLWKNGGRFGRAVNLMSDAVGGALTLPMYLRRLRRAIAAMQPRLIHSNGLKCHLLAGYAAPRACPIVWHMHDFLSPRPVLSKWLKRLARRPAVAIAISKAIAGDVQRALPGVPIETVYNGVDTVTFCPQGDNADLDALAGMPPAKPGTLRVGLVATYARWKGQDVFLDAAAEMARSATADVRFFIVGGPIYSTTGSQFSEEELRTLSAARGLSERCGFVPFQTSLAPVYRALDVMVHASTRPEPFGRTIVEAMACGRAVIVARAGGAQELFSDGRDALGVEPNNPAILAGAILRLCRDSALRSQLGFAARQSAVDRFGRRVMGEALLRVYRSLGVE